MDVIDNLEMVILESCHCWAENKSSPGQMHIKQTHICAVFCVVWGFKYVLCPKSTKTM